MVTSAKNYTKKNKNKKRTDRTLGQMVKAKLYRQKPHTEAYTYTLTKREKGKKYIYHCSQSPPPQFGMIRCLFRYSTDAGYIKVIVEIKSAAPEAAGRDFPFSSLLAQLLGFSFGFGPASACRSPEGVCSHSDLMGLKEQLLRGLWLTQAVGEGGVQMRGEPAAAEAIMMLHQPEARRVFSRGSCPWITGPWQWRAAPAPGRGGVDSDLCLHTGSLLAVAANLASHARLCGPR